MVSMDAEWEGKDFSPPDPDIPPDDSNNYEELRYVLSKDYLPLTPAEEEMLKPLEPLDRGIRLDLFCWCHVDETQGLDPESRHR